MILHGDCHKLMQDLEPGSVAGIITDFPYNTTNCDFDKQPFDLGKFWPNAKRVLKPGGVVISTASQPFTTTLINSNPSWFREELIWIKTNTPDFLNANRRHLKRHESIVVFREFGAGTYNPQKTAGKPYAIKRKAERPVQLSGMRANTINTSGDRYPTSVIAITNSYNDGEHPTQKPVPLYEYLIRTYTNPGDLVLDPCAGSCTTGLAAYNTGRQFICMEEREDYYQIGVRRLAEAMSSPRLFSLASLEPGASEVQANFEIEIAG